MGRVEDVPEILFPGCGFAAVEGLAPGAGAVNDKDRYDR